MTVTAKDRQSLLDVAIQVLGSAEGVFALAERNGMSITTRLSDGQVLEYDLGDVVDERTAAAIAARGICPATDIPPADEKMLNNRTNGYKPGEVLEPLVRPDVIGNFGTQYESGVSTAAHLDRAQQAVAEVEDVLSATFKKAQAAAAKNEVLPSESGQAVTSVFSKQFNDSFA